MNMINKTLTITAYTLALTVAQTALADSVGGPPINPEAEIQAIDLTRAPNSLESTSTTVSYADQDLDSEEGVQAVYRFLQRASKEVCSGGTSRHDRSVIMKSSRLRCYRESLSNAVSQIDNENLTRFHAG